MPEPAESELLAHICTWPLHTRPRLGGGRGRKGSQGSSGAAARNAEPPLGHCPPPRALNPWFSMDPPLCKGLWAGPGMGWSEVEPASCGRARGQGGRANSPVGRATVGLQLLDQELEIYSVLRVPWASPFTCPS